MKKRIKKPDTKKSAKKIYKAIKVNKNTDLNKATVYIIGESPMVEQYAEVCANRGFEVYVSWNSPISRNFKFNSPGINISNSIPADTSVAIELTNIDHLVKKKNIEKLDKVLANTAPLLSSSITMTATEQSSWVIQKHRLVGISALPAFIERPLVEVAPTIYSPKETIDAVSRFFLSIGKDIEIVQDRVGMVLPRIICQVINEATFAITEGIASPQDIDKTLKLGVNFPVGPIELAEQIGLKQVYSVLTAIYSDLQEERYRVAPLLRQIASTGEWWKQTTLK